MFKLGFKNVLERIKKNQWIIIFNAYPFVIPDDHGLHHLLLCFDERTTDHAGCLLTTHFTIVLIG
jgi:hypothetical protein